MYKTERRIMVDEADRQIVRVEVKWRIASNKVRCRRRGLRHIMADEATGGST